MLILREVGLRRSVVMLVGVVGARVLTRRGRPCRSAIGLVDGRVTLFPLVFPVGVAVDWLSIAVLRFTVGTVARLSIIAKTRETARSILLQIRYRIRPYIITL